MESFSILHKASSHKAEKISTGTGKTKAKRRIDLTASEPASSSNLDASSVEFNEYRYLNERMEAFDVVWSRIESSIKDVLREVNATIFSEIHQWVRDSFGSLVSFGMPDLREATQPFPILKDSTSKQIFTGLILTRNIEFVDDLMTFEDLGLHLKSQGCHVANLSSQDFSAKNGVGGCLRSLLRQFLVNAPDVADISMLATWYKEQGNNNNPVVLILDDMERCCASVLSDFIHMLSEWVLKVPVILIMGVATTIDAPSTVLPSSALHCLHAQKFTLQSLPEKMNAVVKAVFLKQCSEFSISHRAALLLRNYFVNQDGTMTSFVRALKMACAQHFSTQPLCFILNWFLNEDDTEVPQSDTYGVSQERMLKLAFDLPSWKSDENKTGELDGESLLHGLSELKKLQKTWRMVVLCLFEAVEGGNVQLLDLLCEALDPKGPFGAERESEPRVLSSDNQRFHSGVAKKGIIHQVVRKVRDLPPKQLFRLLKAWQKHTIDVPQIHSEVKELLSLLKLEDTKSVNQNRVETNNTTRRQALRGGHVSAQKNSNAANEKASKLVELMVRKYMCPIECIAFHEAVCFSSVDKLQAALVGDTRRRIQVDLQEFHDIISCRCCRNRGSTLLPTMPDSSIMYSLAQEHGDVVNVHDWYQSFKSIVLSMHTVPKKAKSKSKSKHYSPSPKKRKTTTVNEAAKPSEASIQARFCKAIVELQVTGLVKMPSRRRPDYLQRLAFGL
ncbi:Origin of replication complex subunit 3 [Linum perenne]